MEHEDITAYLIFGGGGALFGVVIALLCALACHRVRNAFILSAIVSLFGAPTTALIIVGVTGAINSAEQYGFGPTQAILAGISTMFFLMFSLPFICGIPALFAGLATQGLFQCIKMLK